MKLTKITLSVIAAFALAACGSSGSSNKTASTASNNTATASTANTAANRTPAAATNNTSTAANNNAAATTTTTTTTSAAAQATAATSQTGDHQKLTDKAATHSESFVGFKNIVKNKSDLNTNSSTSLDSKADVPEAMQVQELFPSLDTMVLGEELNKKDGKIVYVEDFDYRKTDKAAQDTADTKGKFTLAKIYIDEPTTGGAARPAPEQLGIGNTRTAKEGTKDGESYVFQKGRVNYTNNYTGDVVRLDSKGSRQVAVPASKNQASVVAGIIGNPDIEGLDNQITRSPTGSVAEVYGARTNAEDHAYDGVKKSDFFDFDSSDGIHENAPFQVAQDKTQPDNKNLKHVQYGRVTSALHNRSIADFKDGVTWNNVNGRTLVGSYGKQGDAGTEDHFFYRGLDNTTKQELSALKTANPNGVLTYNGHAVTYGINHNWYGDDTLTPNALGGRIGLVSGTHVKADVHLANGQVNGNAYNVWYDSRQVDPIRNVNLVSFNGTLADNGNIAGKATNYQHAEDSKYRDGVFGATLYGKRAGEMGGIVASNEKGDKQWGFSFGASRETEVSVNTTPSPVTTTPPRTNPLGGANNSGSRL